MILYQLWYSGLPEEFQIKGFDTCIPLGTFGAVSNDGRREMEIGESSNNHYAAVTEHSSQCASESSYGNHKVYMDCKNDGPETKFGVATPPQEFYSSHSTDKNEQKYGSCYTDDCLRNTSIFFAHGWLLLISIILFCFHFIYVYCQQVSIHHPCTNCFHNHFVTRQSYKTFFSSGHRNCETTRQHTKANK